MDLADEYLCIPEEYVRPLGGLRWAPAGDAVDRGDGTTYAFSFQIGAFLEGYLANGPLIHFGYVLHLLGFLRRGDTGGEHGLRGLVQQAFQAAGRSHRNAGAFFAAVCRGVPTVPGAPVSMDLLWRLQYPPHTRQVADPLTPIRGTMPPRPADWFEAHVVCSLEAYGFDELLHWFRHGTGPVKDVSRLAEAVVVRPPSLSAVLAELARSTRLAGALPYVDQFVGALTLPRRRLERHELPIGGYDDVTTRGQPAQLLPGQLALDADEFVRRFAQRELLFFRREEPHARTREDLIVLLDQGVRTWGTIRLMLAAAALALGRYAVRRRLSLRLAATSGAATLDPLRADPAELAALVEASDLSPHPGEALERVLDEAAASPCDVVLLTHPRNLAESGVAAAARRLPSHARLFALSVTAAGDAELNAVRSGAPVTLLRFRVDSDVYGPKPPPPRGGDGMSPWRGDVESIPYPFAFGAANYHGRLRMAFDHSGEWLLTSTARGLLHAVRTDGSGGETWQRPVFGGAVLDQVEAVIGVAGGFAVVGVVCNRLIVCYYDLATRTARVHDTAIGGAAKGTRTWWYVPRTHSVVKEQAGKLWGLDLTSGHQYAPEGVGPGSVPDTTGPLVLRPFRSAPDGVVPEPVVTQVWYANASDPAVKFTGQWPALAFNPEEGSLKIVNCPGGASFTPLSDGRPLLARGILKEADRQGPTLAAVFGWSRDRADATVLRVFRGPEWVAVSAYPLNRGSFVLSDDGRLLALQRGSESVKVLAAVGHGPPLCVAPVGRFHSSVRVEVGVRSLRLHNGVYTHRVCWEEGPLVCEAERTAVFKSEVTNPPWNHPPAAVKDKTRFVKYAYGRLAAAVDLFGQVTLLGYDGRLVCMFFSFRHELAVWAPDGACFGPERLLGVRPTPAAAVKIATALRAACELAQGRVPV